MLIGIPHPALRDSKIRFCYWRTPGVRWGYLCCPLSLEWICPINHVLIFFICLRDPLCDQMSRVQVGTPQSLLGKFPRFWVALLVHLSPLEKGQPTLQVTEKMIASFPRCEIWWGGHGFASVHVLCAGNQGWCSVGIHCGLGSRSLGAPDGNQTHLKMSKNWSKTSVTFVLEPWSTFVI